MIRVLLVDDDPSLRLALKKALTRKGAAVFDLGSGEAAVEPLRSGVGGDGPVDVCVLDLRMPGMGGLEVLRRTVGRRVPVVVLTGHGTVPDAVEAMRLGAVNFMQKPVDADELYPVLEAATREEPPARTATLLGASSVMLAFLEKLDRAAQSEEPILFVGETGTGKELCAQRAHEHSAHRKGPFVPCNVAAIPRDLFESELFGHRRGAFTGASETREGLMAKAADGTLFLDEVGELHADAQAKLLRSLEERRFRPVGADAEKPLRARVVAATHKDLKLAVEAGTFRADLYYRLNVVPLVVPPLRDRGDDIILIARALLGRTASHPLAFTEAAEARLLRHTFPGNVRELVNVVKRAAIFARGDTVDAALIASLLDESPFAHDSARPGSADLHRDLHGDVPRAGERVTLEELEKTHIKRLLLELQNVSEVARIIGIDRRTLQRKMAAWGFRDVVPQGSDPA